MLINDEIQRQVLPTIVKATSMSPGGDVEQRSSSLLQINPGQQVKAEIIATLPNHLYLARIAGELFKIELPVLMEPGQSMALTFVTADPRVTFQLIPSGPAPESIQLTSLGKWLSNEVLNAPPMDAPERLLNDPMQGADALAPRLRDALVQSGLFYESHLAQWAVGKFQLQEILKEPQGRLSRVGQKEESADRPEAKRDTAQNSAYADPGTLSVVKEQLSLLRNGFLVWKGEAWPDQEMELVVSREKGEEGDPAVQASLSLALPQLGEVQATLRILPEGLSVELVCDRAGSSQQLKDGVADLRAALSSAGVRLGRMAVRDVEPGR